jgi:CYTH domain-containing protein
MEIERKYLIDKLPENIEKYPRHKIAQGYLCTRPVVRIRRQDEEYYMTYKGDGLMVREEYNLPLTKEAYEHLLPKADDIIIAKTRYLIPLTEGTGIDRALTAELDVFEDSLAPLMVVEVEFESVEEAEAFVAPEWFGEDVTNEGTYQNSYLCKHGLPASIRK